MCTAENVFRGTVLQVLCESITIESIVMTNSGLQLCSIISRESGKKINLNQNDGVWVIFNCFTVVLHVAL